MTEPDAVAVSQIVVAGYVFLAEREGFSEQQVKRLLAERSSETVVRERWLREWDCYVAECGARVVGALAIERHEIAELWVLPDYHRQGTGAALFRKAEGVIAASGYRHLTLRCATLSSKLFYETMGTEIVDTRPCSSGPLSGWPLTYYRKNL
jgi:GNAT superfamily N-acetyltransferase